MVLDQSPSINTIPPAMQAVQKLISNELIDFTVNYNLGPCYVFGIFNFNQGPTTKRSLNNTDGIKEHIPSRHQQQP
jgi:hypothetical protein